MARGSNKNTRVSNNTGYKNLSHRGRPNTPRVGIPVNRKRYENGGKKCK